ncbi:MAG: sigma-54 interaction domain-containing protein [Candidatus Binatia bacterium]
MADYSTVESRDRLGACLSTCDTLGRILDSVSDGIITIDQRMRIISFNRAATALTGFTREEAAGRRFTDLFTDGLAEDGALLRNALEKGEYVSDLEREIVGKAGQRRLVRITMKALFEAGGLGGVVIALRDVQQIHELREQLKGQSEFNAIIGKNHKMREIYGLIEQVADSHASVLVHGESGTGKELVARAIHQQSPRQHQPFVTVNCAALVETLLESELFGHVRGAFTGAVSAKLGRFELADGGTIFLDEIGDVSPPVQVKLLRVLQEKEFDRVGESKTNKVDVRVIAATNKNLWELVREGRFRDDLYYRLKVVSINLPALRERRDDIPLLVQHFVEKFNRQTGKTLLGCTRQAMAALMNYLWPGNIRELENAIEHAFVLCRGEYFSLDDLPPEIGKARLSEGLINLDAPGEESVERQRILTTLKSTEGLSEAARRLGISRTTLWRKLKRMQDSLE